MRRPTEVPISGAVLEWAISAAGLTEQAFAEKMRVGVETVRSWEAGAALPTKTQFNRMVSILKRPSSVFFLPKPPVEPAGVVELRQPPGEDARSLTEREARWLRRARSLQAFASWLSQEMGMPARDFPHATVAQDPEIVARRERKRIGVTIEQQVTGWGNVTTAFDGWRSALENVGLLVFQFRLGRGAVRGFSLWDRYAPVITVNWAYNEQARIFTLFHEYAHLLLRETVMCSGPAGAYFLVDRGSERWCERFAASLLLPADTLLKDLRELGWSGAKISHMDKVGYLARRYKVSLRATALRLIDLGVSDPSLYETVDRLAQTDLRVGRPGGRGLPQHKLRIKELGTQLPSLLLEAMHEGFVQLYDVLSYMNVSTASLAQLREILR